MKKLLIILGILIIIVVVAVGAFAIYNQKSTVPSQTNTNPFGNTIGGNTQPNGGSAQTAGTIPITDNGGTVLNVPDFTKTTPQLPSSNATDGYQVAGNPDGTQSAYDIVYFPAQSYFDISILSEPVGSNRVAAEEALTSKLQVPNTELCKLNVQVYAQVGVNDQYAGQNLGVSFCPGSVVLPN